MIPKTLLVELLSDPYYKRCARADSTCSGRVTFEHAFIYAGKQIQEKWAIIPLCVHHHLGHGLIKDLNWHLALQRADVDDLTKRMPKKNWKQLKEYLKTKYADSH